MSDIAKEFLLQAREDSIKYDEEQYERFKRVKRCDIKQKVKTKQVFLSASKYMLFIDLVAMRLLMMLLLTGFG